MLEILARLFDPLGISYLPETSRFLDTMIHEQPIGYRLRPGLDGDFNGARYQINSLGFRGPEMSTSKPADEKRVLFMGDSIAFGVGVGNDQTIPSVVERLAAVHGTYRFANMGVPSYNTEQELIQFETLGQTLKPDGVVLLFSSNDIEAKDWAFGSQNSWIVGTIQRSYALSLSMLTVYRIREATRDPASAKKVTFSADDPRWQRVAVALRKLKEHCDRLAIPFTVVFLGTESEFPYDLLVAEGRDRGIDVVGIRASDDPRWPDGDSLKYRNSVTDSHPNQAGCEMFGRLIYEALERRGYFARP